MVWGGWSKGESISQWMSCIVAVVWDHHRERERERGILLDLSLSKSLFVPSSCFMVFLWVLLQVAKQWMIRAHCEIIWEEHRISNLLRYHHTATQTLLYKISITGCCVTLLHQVHSFLAYSIIVTFLSLS